MENLQLKKQVGTNTSGRLNNNYSSAESKKFEQLVYGEFENLMRPEAQGKLDLRNYVYTVSNNFSVKRSQFLNNTRTAKLSYLKTDETVSGEEEIKSGKQSKEYTIGKSSTKR